MKWIDIKEFENLYQINEFGFIRNKVTNRILRQSKNDNGYYQVGIFIQKRQRKYKIHRLLAEIFIPNPKKLPCVNHINGNKSDNRIENLEWCSYSHNTKEAYRIGLCKKQRGENKIIIDLNTGIYYNHAKELSGFLGINRITLCNWLKGRCINKTNYRYA